MAKNPVFSNLIPLKPRSKIFLKFRPCHFYFTDLQIHAKFQKNLMSGLWDIQSWTDNAQMKLIGIYCRISRWKLLLRKWSGTCGKECNKEYFDCNWPSKSGSGIQSMMLNLGVILKILMVSSNNGALFCANLISCTVEPLKTDNPRDKPKCPSYRGVLH